MNFEARYIHNQCGAVLIFSMIMLLLLTLASVSMIQQNKQELAMTGNILDQTASFAGSEAELGAAEKLIDEFRVADSDNHTCNLTHPSLDVGSLFSTSKGEATITAIFCLDRSGGTTVCGNSLDDCNCANRQRTEIFAIRWKSSATSNYGSQRVLESDYAVNCVGGLQVK